MNIALRAGLTITGLIFIILGMSLNQIFYYSLASDVTVYQFAYSAIGIGLDASKVLALLLTAAFISSGIALMVITGFFTFTLYLSLAAISLIAGWGFSLVVAENYEASKMQASAQYQLALSNQEMANDKLNQLAQHATLNLTELENAAQTELSKQVQNSSGANAGTLAQRTSNCTNTSTYYYRYCTPYNELQAKIQNAQAYQAAINAKQLATQEMANIDANGLATSTVHPVFIGMASMGILGNTPELAKYRFTFISFTLIEIIGAFFFAIGVMFKNRASMTVHEMSNNMQLIQANIKAVQDFQQNLGLPQPATNSTPINTQNNTVK